MLDDLPRWMTMVRPGDSDQWLCFDGAGENLAWSRANFENCAQPRPRLADHATSDLRGGAISRRQRLGVLTRRPYDETIRQDLDAFEELTRDGGFPARSPRFFDHARPRAPRASTGLPRSAQRCRCRTA